MSLLRVLFAFALATVFFAQFSQPAFAQTQPVSQSFAPPPTEADVPQDTGTLAQTVLLEFFSFAACQLTGVGFTHPEGKCLEYNMSSSKFGYAENNGAGLIGFLGQGIGYTYNMPTSTYESIASLRHNFGITKSAHAQEEEGVGFSGLSAFQQIWNTSRNIVYSLFVILFLFIGLGIMLQRNINPQTVMSVQNQLPKIVIGLLLITFSYAIAGFLIDLMWVSVFLVLSIFESIANNTDGIHSLTSISNLSEELYRTPFGFANNILSVEMPFTIPFTEVDDVPFGLLGIPFMVAGSAGIFITGGIAESAISHELLRLPLIITGFFHPASLLCYVGQVFPFESPSITELSIGWKGFGNMDDVAGCLAQTHPVTQILGGVGMLVVFFVVLFALLIALIKLWIALLKAYVKVIIGTVLAPFWIAAGLIPGSTQGFEGWLRFMGANLVPFPVVIFMFALAQFLLLNMNGDSGNSMFVPPLVGNPADIGFLSSIIALGIILVTPDIVKRVQEVIGTQGEDLGGAVQGTVVGGASIPAAGGNVIFKGMMHEDGALGSRIRTAAQAGGIKGKLGRIAEGYVRRSTGGGGTGGRG